MEIRLELTASEIEQIKESLFYHYECAEDQTLHEENCRIIEKIKANDKQCKHDYEEHTYQAVLCRKCGYIELEY